jgi:hypothetical protein
MLKLVSGKKLMQWWRSMVAMSDMKPFRKWVTCINIYVYPTFFWQDYLHMSMKLFGIILWVSS